MLWKQAQGILQLHMLCQGQFSFSHKFSKKSNRSIAPAVVGIELKTKDDLPFLVERMKNHNFKFDYLNEKENLFQFLI